METVTFKMSEQVVKEQQRMINYLFGYACSDDLLFLVHTIYAVHLNWYAPNVQYGPFLVFYITLSGPQSYF